MEPFSLIGIEDNAFNVMAYTSRAMKKANYSKEEIDNYRKLAMSGDYDQLLVLSMEWIDKCNEVLGLQESHSAEKEGFAKFGPGKYFIGDICYALPDEIYDKIWGEQYKYEDGFYGNFAVHGTAYGDGCYLGSDGREYSVDAGVIGVTDISKSQRYSDVDLERLGKIVQVNDSLIMNCDELGNFEFIVDGKCFEIITSDTQDEEDEDEWEEE